MLTLASIVIGAHISYLHKPPEIPTELCVYQPSDEFAEPHMDVPSVPAMVPQRTSEKGGKQ